MSSRTTTVEIPQAFLDAIDAGRLNEAARDVLASMRAAAVCETPQMRQRYEAKKLIYELALDADDARDQAKGGAR